MSSLVYHIPLAQLAAYRGHPLIVRSARPHELVSQLGAEDLDNLAYVQLCSLPSDTDILIHWAEDLAIELRLVHADELKRPVKIPAVSVADVTPRRLQKFRVEPGRTYSWRLEREGETIRSGVAQTDDVGLLSIQRLPITARPARLVINRTGKKDKSD